MTGIIESIPDQKQEIDFSNGPVNVLDFASSSSPYTYMRDLTERGRDVDESKINDLIYLNVPQK